MTQESPSLITEEMRAGIGREGPPVRHEGDKTGIRMFARAVGHTDLVFYDEEYAKSKGHRSIIAPPSYLGTPAFSPRTGGGGFTRPGLGPRRPPLARPQRRQRVRVHRRRHLRRRRPRGRLEDGEHPRDEGQSGPEAHHPAGDPLHEPERRGRLPRRGHEPELLGGRQRWQSRSIGTTSRKATRYRGC